jgi:shikimate kinase
MHTFAWALSAVTERTCQSVPAGEVPRTGFIIHTRGKSAASWPEAAATRTAAGDGDRMKRVLLTGMSGVGKSAVLEELGARGYRAVDTDYGGLSEVVSVPAETETGLGPGHDWVWREDRIQELLSKADTDVLFLGGCAPNQGKFYPQFDHIILLTAPAPVIIERLASRTTNPFGKRPEEVARVLNLVQTIEPLLRRVSQHIVDTRGPLDQVVTRVLRLVGEHA